jgi:hypothetical protein
MRRFTLAVAFLVVPSLTALPAVAQVRGGGGHIGGGGGHAVVSAPRAGGFAAAPIGRSVGGGGFYRGGQGRVPGAVTSGRRIFSTQRVPRAASTLSAFGTSNSVPNFGYPVPGLGFDYVHFAAVHPNGVGFGRRGFDRGRGRQGFFPFFDSGFLLPYAPGYYDDAYDDEPGPGYDNQAGAAQDVPPLGQDVNGERLNQPYPPQQVSAYDVVVQPQKPTEQYVFVRRDGSVFFAVAYSWQAGDLYYVTQEGARRSVSRDALDLDATQQFNEQRGLSFQAPARS